MIVGVVTSADAEVFQVALSRCVSTDGGNGDPPKFQPPPKPVMIDKSKTEASHRRFLSPEFIPPRQRTNPFKFAIERKDMIQRRKIIDIPEFYVGSVLAVVMADVYASGKSNRFVGICTQRSGKGLGATFVLRNIIDGQGVEICYDLYSPRIQQIEVLKFEKRLDDNLMYLRDALPEYSTFDFDMKAMPPPPPGAEVPINQQKVKMKPRPWSKRWERSRFNIKGIQFELYFTEEELTHAKKWDTPWVEYDMLKEYDTSNVEKHIWTEVQRELSK
ncbi:39S ribosomal protein L19, mitochondrial isoform X2 [Protopterus annectens]|uniref:39S ribosomal protein L19, mitochondrial isoform X2 n=1 Tax=Protopterus annectens TaxID=7888 RepID=UPI001CF94BC6|nr:39S ribosomal protein L19, mitochondrial isoform X2 [Protopterus annectens]